MYAALQGLQYLEDGALGLPHLHFFEIAIPKIC